MSATARTAVVTGVCSGIGAATARRLRAQGWEVIGIDISDADGVVRADVSDPEAMRSAGEIVGERPLHGLVCAAGIWPTGDDRYASIDLEVWTNTWAVNVTGTMLTMRSFAPLLQAGGGVVTFASIAALVGMPRRDAYTASKGAIVALSRAWAVDLIRRGVRVNCLAPGIVSTPMAEAHLGGELPEIPLGRTAQAEEIASIAVATLAPDATYLNGALIPIDAGLTAAAHVVPVGLRPGVAFEPQATTRPDHQPT